MADLLDEIIQDVPRNITKILGAFAGTFLSLVAAFVAKDYFLKSGYVYYIEDQQTPYISILKQVIDDDVYKRTRSADFPSTVANKNEPITKANITNAAQISQIRMLNAINKIEPIETLQE